MRMVEDKECSGNAERRFRVHIIEIYRNKGPGERRPLVGVEAQFLCECVIVTTILRSADL
jgi:hypothetical protein